MGAVARRRLFARVASAAVAAALLPAALLAPRARAGGSTPVGGYATVGNGTSGKIAGASLTDIGVGSTGEAAAAERMHTDGLNTVTLYVWWEADSPTGSSVHPYSDTVSDTSLVTEMTTAEAAGLQVMLVPVFYCTGCEGGDRSVIHPANVDAFFASYGAFVDHYAALAQANGATTFFVGSELSSLERANQWGPLIRGVRQVFHGRIGYEENWDVLGNANFLGAVDLIGVSAYFPLDGAASPSLAQLLADWHGSTMPGWQGRNWVAAVAWLAGRFGKHVVFGEVGYMSGDYAASHPYLDNYATPNLPLQADLYQALLETFSGYSWWAGTVWWDYQVTPDALAANGRTFTGKLAETLLQMWYADGIRPSSPDTPLL